MLHEQVQCFPISLAITASLSTSTTSIVEGNETVEVCATLTGPTVFLTSFNISVALNTTDGNYTIMMYDFDK